MCVFPKIVGIFFLISLLPTHPSEHFLQPNINQFAFYPTQMDQNSPNSSNSNPNFSNQNQFPNNLPFLDLLNQGFPPQGFNFPNQNAFQNNPYPIQNQFPQQPFTTTSRANLTPYQLQEIMKMQQQYIQLQGSLGAQGQSSQQNATPSPQQNATPSPRRLIDEDIDIVEETQPEKLTRKNARAKKKATIEGLKRVKWTEDEEVVLAESYVDISVDSVKGNAQQGDAFWDRVSKRFHDAIGKGYYRTNDALSGKWTTLQRDCNLYNGYYNNAKDMHMSGANVENVGELALATFKTKNGEREFGHLRAWRVLHNNKKWEWKPSTMETMSQSSGSKRSEPEVASFDMNSEPNEEDVQQQQQQQQQGQKRPIGRNRAKRLAQQQPPPPAAPNVGTVVAEKIGGRLDKHFEYLELKEKNKFERHREAQMESDIRVLGYVPKPEVSRKNLKAITKMQDMIRARWNVDENEDEAEDEDEDEV